MSNYFDDLIREGRDTDATRLFAREYYEYGKAYKFAYPRAVLKEAAQALAEAEKEGI